MKLDGTKVRRLREEVERAYDSAKEWDGRSWSREAGLRAVMALYARAALPKGGA